MTQFEITFNSDDPAIRKLLAEAARLPERSPERLRIEAGLCQWWANRCHEQIGSWEGTNRMEANRQARARATRERNRDEKAAAETRRARTERINPS